MSDTEICALCGKFKWMHWQSISRPIKHSCSGYLDDYREFTPLPKPASGPAQEETQP
jgi:hypothetical protein